MFKFGYKFYVIRRNNAIPSVHSSISESITYDFHIDIVHHKCYTYHKRRKNDAHKKSESKHCC